MLLKKNTVPLPRKDTTHIPSENSTNKMKPRIPDREGKKKEKRSSSSSVTVPISIHENTAIYSPCKLKMGMPYWDQNLLGERNNNSDSDGRVLLNTHIDIYINICISSGKCYLWRRKFGIFACIGIPTCRGGFTGHIPKASACSPLSCKPKKCSQSWELIKVLPVPVSLGWHFPPTWIPSTTWQSLFKCATKLARAFCPTFAVPHPGDVGKEEGKI